MKKKIIICLIVAAVFIALTALTYAIVLDRQYGFELYGEAECIDNGCFLYQGERYREVEPEIFRTDIKQRYLISWRFDFPFRQICYSYTKDSPDWFFINDEQVIYISEDYDYTADVFTVGRSDKGIVFSEAFIADSGVKGVEFDESVKTFDWRSQTHRELYAPVTVNRKGDDLYLSFGENGVYSVSYMISPGFLELLTENGYIK